ncbi:hypothetical protein H2200_007692 [Cladophialophora chaetospira]|uniref:Uncharacterized protein n=1 Tax=Cladophialophora chaetospira TaxID=386627 RepID=A0AA38X6B1_9EURO|nr:hypothetical protein H2200_007692 [Cladophialophora chaetospira]
MTSMDLELPFGAVSTPSEKPPRQKTTRRRLQRSKNWTKAPYFPQFQLTLDAQNDMTTVPIGKRKRPVDPDLPRTLAIEPSGKRLHPLDFIDIRSTQHSILQENDNIFQVPDLRRSSDVTALSYPSPITDCFSSGAGKDDTPAFIGEPGQLDHPGLRMTYSRSSVDSAFCESNGSGCGNHEYQSSPIYNAYAGEVEEMSESRLFFGEKLLDNAVEPSGEPLSFPAPGVPFNESLGYINNQNMPHSSLQNPTRRSSMHDDLHRSEHHHLLEHYTRFHIEIINQLLQQTQSFRATMQQLHQKAAPLSPSWTTAWKRFRDRLDSFSRELASSRILYSQPIDFTWPELGSPERTISEITSLGPVSSFATNGHYSETVTNVQIPGKENGDMLFSFGILDNDKTTAPTPWHESNKRHIPDATIEDGLLNGYGTISRTALEWDYPTSRVRI